MGTIRRYEGSRTGRKPLECLLDAKCFERVSPGLMYRLYIDSRNGKMIRSILFFLAIAKGSDRGKRR